MAVGHWSRLKSGVLPDTRVDLISVILSWAQTNDPDQSMYMITGGAGTGKSTLAFSLAEELQKRDQLGASFFFSRDTTDVAGTQNFVGAVALQLASHSPFLRTEIIKAIQSRTGTPPIEEDFQQLIVQPCSKLPPESPPIVIIVDALDECLDHDQRNELLHLLSTKCTGTPLKILLTGRPETHHRFTHRANCILHELDKKIVDQDIKKVIQDGFRKVSQEWDCGNNWYAITDVDQLVANSGGLFIYVSTTIKFLLLANGVTPRVKLRRILDEGAKSKLGPQNALDALYAQVLNSALPKDATEADQEMFFNAAMPVIGFVVLLQQPLSASSLAGLLRYDMGGQSGDTLIKDSFDVRAALNPLGSVILLPSDDDNPIRPLHASFHDFITDPDRRWRGSNTSIRDFFINSEIYHSRIAAACLGHLSETLQKNNVLDLPNPLILTHHVANLDEIIKTHLTLQLQYACTYGLSHLIKVFTLSNSLINQLFQFLQTNLMRYLEVLSVLGRVGVAVRALGDVYKWYQVCDFGLFQLFGP